MRVVNKDISEVFINEVFVVGGCCTYQTNMYLEYGQRNGLSPDQYFDKIFQFATAVRQKNLVYVKVNNLI